MQLDILITHVQLSILEMTLLIVLLLAIKAITQLWSFYSRTEIDQSIRKSTNLLLTKVLSGKSLFIVCF